METICCKCGRSFFTWELTVQHLDYPICTRCETLNDFFGTWHDHLVDVDPHVRQLYFETLMEIEEADPTVYEVEVVDEVCSEGQ